MGGIDSRLDQAEQIREFKDITIETMQIETHREKFEKRKQSFS